MTKFPREILYTQFEVLPFTTMNTVLNQQFICTATIGTSLQPAFIEVYFSTEACLHDIHKALKWVNFA